MEEQEQVNKDQRSEEVRPRMEMKKVIQMYIGRYLFMVPGLTCSSSSPSRSPLHIIAGWRDRCKLLQPERWWPWA
jgi:hypothetical protein